MKNNVLFLTYFPLAISFAVCLAMQIKLSFLFYT